MSYISKERVSEIRKQLRKEFTELKLSVRRVHYSTVEVSILEGPYDFFNMINQDVFKNKPSEYLQVNEFYIKEHWTGKAKEIFLRIKEIAAKDMINRNANDPYADYADFNFHFDLNIGKWNKPYKVI